MSTSKPWWWKSCDDAPADYFAKVIAPTIPKLPADHPRRQYTRDFYGVWTHKVTGERLLPDQFARLEMAFDSRPRPATSTAAIRGGEPE